MIYVYTLKKISIQTRIYVYYVMNTIFIKLDPKGNLSPLSNHGHSFSMHL